MLRVKNFYKPTILVILNRQVLYLQTDWISDQCWQIDYEAGLLTRIFLEEVSGFFALIKYNISAKEDLL